jgi:hypothetical protein
LVIASVRPTARDQVMLSFIKENNEDQRCVVWCRAPAQMTF